MSQVDITDNGINERAMKGWNDWLSAWLGAVSRAWTDPTFKAQLLADPAAALKQLGYDLPGALTLQVVDLGSPDHVELPVSNHSPYVFTPGLQMPKQTLVIGLLARPADLADGLITLANHQGQSTAQ